MKLKILEVVILVVLSMHLVHAQEVSMQDSCMIVYGTGTVTAPPEMVTLYFTRASLVEETPPGMLAFFEEAVLDLDMMVMDTLTYRNYLLWPYAVRRTEKVKHGEDSIKVDFALKLGDMTDLGKAISMVSVDPYCLIKISYSLIDESKKRKEAYKKAIDNAVEKVNYTASQFYFVKGPILNIEEISSSVETVEPGVYFIIRSTVKVVFRVLN